MSFISSRLLFIALLIAITSTAQNPLINSPIISPDGKQIAFNFQGDIWVGNSDGKDLKRITIHEAYDANPIWSHDGSSIAFQSDRYGNNDIYVISAQGGLPKRITFHSANDYLTDYTRDGKLLFITRRDFAQVEREYEIHSVSDQGGTPSRFLNTLGFDARVSPNGKFIVFVKGACTVTREAYRGPANRNIWLYNVSKDTYTQLTDFDGNDFSPYWGDDATIYFQSSLSGKYNIHKMTINASGQKVGGIESVTAFKDMGIFSFSVSKNGKDLAMVQGDKLFVLNTALNNKPKEVKLDLQSDYRFDPIEHKTYTNNIEDIALSPNGKQTALVIRGELFIRSTDKDNKKTVNVSKSPYRDRMPTWLNDSSLVFVSDRDGQNDLYLLKSDDTKEADLLKTLKYKVERLTSTKEGESDPIMAPNGELIAFKRGRHKSHLNLIPALVL